MKTFFSTLIILVIITNTYAQFMAEDSTFCRSCAKETYLKYTADLFIKNNEYFGKFDKGYTGLGVLFKPNFSVYLTNKTQFLAGAFLLQYFGKEGKEIIHPTFRIRHNFSDKFSLIFGNIFSTSFHNLKAQIFKIDRFYQENIENGFQILYTSNFIQSDIWLDWENFIEKDDPFLEELTFGSSNSLTIYHKKNLKLSLPTSSLINHKGGQIDNSSKKGHTIINTTFGFKLEKQTKTIKFYMEPTLLNYFGSKNQFFDRGSAFDVKTGFKTERFNTQISLWYGNKFLSTKGESLFSSLSEFDNNYFEKKRTIYTFHFDYFYNPSSAFQLKFSTDIFYESLNKNIEHSMMLHLKINQQIFLKHVKS